MITFIAGMVELVDTQASGACGGNPVEVRVLFPAPTIYIEFLLSKSLIQRDSSI